MRVIVAGSRTITDPQIVEQAITASCFVITEMITGGARGVDELAFAYARDWINVPNHVFHAQWALHGNAAGPFRNELMAQNADACIAIWDGKSKGTANMIAMAKRYKLQLFVWRTDLCTGIKPIDL